MATFLVALCLGVAWETGVSDVRAEVCQNCNTTQSNGGNKPKAGTSRPKKATSKKKSQPMAQPSRLDGIRVGAERGLTRIVLDFDRVPTYELNWITEGQHLRVTLLKTTTRAPGLIRQPEISLFKSAEITPPLDDITSVDLHARESVYVRAYIVGKEPGHGPRLVLEARPGKPEIFRDAATPPSSPSAKSPSHSSQKAPPPPERKPLPTPPTVKEIRNGEARKPHEKEAEKVFQNAVTHLRNNQMDDGEKKLRQALQADPSYLPARVVLVHHLLERNKLKDAIGVIENGLARQPYSKKLGKLYVNALMKNGEPTKAREHLNQLLEQEQGDASLFALRAILLQQSERDEEAIADFRHALDLNKDPGIWWAGMGRSLERIGRMDEAVQAYQTAMNHEISDPFILRYVRSRLLHLEQTVPHGSDLGAP